jgi:hypothetical protein
LSEATKDAPNIEYDLDANGKLQQTYALALGCKVRDPKDITDISQVKGIHPEGAIIIDTIGTLGFPPLRIMNEANLLWLLRDIPYIPPIGTLNRERLQADATTMIQKKLDQQG